MSGSRTTPKNARAASLAVFVTMLFLVSLLPTGVATSHPITQEVNLDSFTAKGDGAIVGFQVIQNKGVALSLPTGVTATKVDSGGGKDYYTGEIAFVSSTTMTPPGASGVVVQASENSKTLSFPSSAASGGPKTLTWSRTHDLEITGPTGTAAKTFWGTAATTIVLKDKDSGGCADLPTILYLDGHEWKPFTVTDCTALTGSTNANTFRYNLTLPLGHPFAEGDRVLVGVIDAAAANGRPTIDETQYVYRESGTPTISILRAGSLTPASGDIPSGDYVLHVRDARADINGTLNGKPTGTLDKVTVKVTSNVHTQPLTFTLTETGPDTGAFTKPIRIATTAGTDTVLVTGTDTTVTATYSGAIATATWKNIAAPTVTVTPSTNVVYTDTLTVTVDDPHQPAPAAGKDLVIRTTDVYAAECSAATFDLAQSTAATSPACATISSLSGNTGTVKLVPGGGDLSTACGATPDCAAILVKDGSLITVEYRDAVAPNGQKDQPVSSASSTRIWKMAFQGSISLDGDAYYVGETMTIRLVDPDQTSGNTRTIALGNAGITRDVTLTGGSGVFTGTVTIGTASGQFPASNGDTITATYVDTLPPGSSPETVTATVIEQPTGRATSDKSGVAGTQSFKLTLKDNNLGATEVPPYATSPSLFGTHKDTIHFKPVDSTTSEATVKSAYAVTTVTKTPTLRSGSGPFGTASCWYEIDLGEPFEAHGLKMVRGTQTWTHKVEGTMANQGSARVFQADYRNGLIIIDAIEPLPTQSCPSRNDVSDLKVTYTPAATLVEEFIFDDVTTSVPLGQYLTTPTFVGGSTGWGPKTLTQPQFGDTTPAQDGTVTAPKNVLFWKGADSLAANKCAYIKIEPSNIKCSNVDLVTGNITISPTPEPGTVIRVEYRASGTVRDPATANVLSHTPVLAGSVFNSTGGRVVPSTTAALEAMVGSGVLPNGHSCPCFYRTDLIHDNALDYGSEIPAESGRKMQIDYIDLVAKDGLQQSVPLKVSIAKSGTTQLRLLDDKGSSSRFFFGTSGQPTIHLNHPQGDLDPSGFDTLTVAVSSTPVSNAGAAASVLETETVTLTETGLSTGKFRGPLRFETSAVGNNGILHVASHDSVQLDLEHAASGATARGWYFKTTAATLTTGTVSFFGTPGIPLTVSDPDAGTRYVNVTKTVNQDTQFRIKDIAPGLSTINAIETSTVVVYACNNAGECRILKQTDGSPSSAMPKTSPTGPLVAGVFKVDSAGNLRHSNPTGFTPDYVRVDFKAVRKDTTSVTPVVIHDDGSATIKPTVTLSETGSATNTFTGQVTPASLGLTDNATVRFVYQDRTYAAIGNNGCSASAPDCPSGVERVPGRADILIRDVTWTPAETGDLTARWAGSEIAPGHLVVRGSEVVRVELRDSDRNQDAAVADSVSVDLLKGGSVDHTVLLHETDANSGVFVGDITLSGWTSGTTWDLRYVDPAGATGQTFSTRLSDPSDISASAMVWRPADIGTLAVSPGRIASVAGKLQVTLTDIDRNLNTAQKDEVVAGHFFITEWVNATSGSPVPSKLEETSASSGRFTGEWTLNLAAGKRYFIVYKDPSDLENRQNRVVATFETLPAGVNVPAFGASSYESGSSLITLNVTGLSPNDPRSVDIWYRSPTATTWSKGTPSLTLGAGDATSFTLVATTGVTQVKAAGGGQVPLNSELLAVYNDNATGLGRGHTVIGSGAAQPVSQAVVASGEKGTDDWYVTAPTVAFSAKEHENRLSGFQYRLNEGSTQSCTNLPCSLTITLEGTNKLEYRALDLAGTPEQFDSGKLFNEMTVKFDATAPTANVSALSATSGKDGAIDLSWTGLPASTPETDFTQYLVFRGTNSTPIGNVKETKFKDSSLTEEGEYSYWVAIEDAAGNRGPMAGPVKGISDKTPPAVSKVGVTPKVVVEGQDALRVDLFILLDGTTPSDFDKAQVLVTPPAGGGNAQTIVLSANGLNHTGTFTNFNVSGTYAFSFQALDKAGNFQPFSDTVRFKAIDRTPPIVEVPTQVEEGKSLTVTVKDNDAGIAAITYKLNGGTAQTVTVSGNPLEHKFTVSTAGLALGDHTLEITAIDANGTTEAHRNSATYTRTFEVVPKGTLPDDGDDDDDDTPIGNKPIIQAVSSLAEANGDFRFRVSSNSLSALVVSFDGGAGQIVLGDWQDAATPVAVSIGSLETGKEHSARVTATNAAGTTTSDFTFFVLDEGIPLPPELVTPKKNKDGQPEITWTASPSSNVGGYLVHRAASPSKVIAVLGADALSFVDKTAKDGKTYAYAVTAYGTNGEGKLEEGADSTELAWFTHVQASTFKLDAEEPGIMGLWWVFLILAVVIGGIAAVYVFRERLFKPRGEEEYEDEYPDEAASPFGVARHHLRCPNCTHEFSVSGQKPIVTTCPNCGKKGILR